MVGNLFETKFGIKSIFILAYIKLKDKIELEKTLTKYRNDINNILTGSIIRNRKAEPLSKLLTDQDTAGGYNRPQTSNTHLESINRCPKQGGKKSFLGSLKTRLFSDSILSSNLREEDEERNPYDISKTTRRAPLHRNDEKNEHPIGSPSKSTQIYKDTNSNIFQSINNFFQNKLTPFISHCGLQISKILPYLVIILFTLITLQYLRMKFLTDNTRVIENDSKPIKIEHFYCSDIKDTKCADTKMILKELIDYLRLKSGQIDCANKQSMKTLNYESQATNLPVEYIDKSVHINQVIDHLFSKKKLVKNSNNEKEAIESVLKALIKNPHWQIKLLNDEYTEVLDIDKVNYLVSDLSTKSFVCRFKELVHFIYVRVIMFATILASLILAYFIYLRLKRISYENDRDFYDLVTKVTTIVEKHYDLSLLDPENIKPYIAISHVYDTLFSPSERQGKKKLWLKVVKFIEDHESRIHLETQFIDGEETHVWKWILPKHDPKKLLNRSESGDLSRQITSTMPLTQNNLILNQKENTVPSTGTPVWQGDAFGRTEKLAHSPTPCLKIRNMFDPVLVNADPRLTIKITNDILEKCSSSTTQMVNDTILHISCDRKSKEGCVYVKCVSNEAAGKVYQTLNGTWYNGKLLNVKFLRSDRYADRFPDSANSNTFIRLLKI